jgi:hypothetical protein
MSIPAAVAQIATGTVPALNPFDVLMGTINTNPYFIGLMMLLLNLGGRFLALEISKEQEKFLAQPMVRRFFLFAVLFVATRNVLIAAALAIIMIVFIGYLFNENSDLCLWKPCSHIPLLEVPTKEGFQGLTAEEAMIFKRLQDKQTAAANAMNQQQEDSQKSSKGPVAPSPSMVYQNAITKLQSLF